MKASNTSNLFSPEFLRRLSALTLCLLLASCGDSSDPESGEGVSPPPLGSAEPATGMSANDRLDPFAVETSPIPKEATAPVASVETKAVPASEPSPSLPEPLRSLNPLGFWPLNEGSGALLKDASGRGNHARAHNLEWRNGLIDFTSGYQWIGIPLHADYTAARSFSLGGWYFSRRDDYLGGSNVDGSKRQEMDMRHTQGVNLFGSAYDGRGSWIYWGARDLRDGVALRLRAKGGDIYEGGNLLGVIHANRGDVLNSAQKGVRLPAGEWIHVLYTFSGGRGDLYFNGEPVASAEGVAPTTFGRPFMIGNDMSWWMLYPEGTQSLHGSVRDLVLFDRALSGEEVARLAAMRPEQKPQPLEPTTALFEWAMADPEALLPRSPEAARHFLRTYTAKSPTELRAAAPELLAALPGWLEEPLIAVELVELLQALDRAEARSLLNDRLLPLLAARLEDAETTDAAKAHAVLAAGKIGEPAAALVPLLRKALEAEIEGTGDSFSGVEDFYRNALTRSLLDLDREGAETRELLGRALARPLLAFDGLDPEVWPRPYQLALERRWMDAMEAYRAGDPASKGVYFFTEGDAYRDGRESFAPNDRAYAPQAISEGVTYMIGSGVPWHSAKQIDRAAFLESVELLPTQYREAARNWQYAGSDKLFQIELHKTLPDGTKESALLEGPWMIFEGHDQKLQGWTIDIDSEGYLHLLGGMHNRPNPDYYVPGSWEMIGLERGANAPTLMYWVSKRPRDITEFEFVGHRDGARNLPSPGMNYMNFVRDAENNMFLYGRISAQAIQSWGVYRYDAREQRWSAVGGDARDVVAEVRKTVSEDPLIQRTGNPWDVRPPQGDETVFAWSWQPHFYNYIRAWGARFDPSGRMHVRMRLRGLAEDARVVDSQVYAWSDDRGRSWHRADGSALHLPLTTNPAPSHNADVRLHGTEERWQLWVSLVEEAGFRFAEPDPLQF